MQKKELKKEEIMMQQLTALHAVPLPLAQAFLLVLDNILTSFCQLLMTSFQLTNQIQEI